MSDRRSRQQLVEDALPIAQEFHRLMLEVGIDLMTFIAAAHIADKIAILYWKQTEPSLADTVDEDAQVVRDCVAKLEFGVISKRPAAQGSIGGISGVTQLDRPLTENPKKGPAS